MAVDADDSLVGQVLDGRYAIKRILGVGGMGAVYEGTHEVLGHSVAVKVMRSSQPDAAARFLAEARRTFRLDNPHCVRVTDAGVTPDKQLYLVMELLEGRTLGEELDHEPKMGWQRVAHISGQIAEAIECAHQSGFIHRDLKPDNVMLMHRDRDPDFAKVLDFGLAKLTTSARLDGKHSVMSLTQHGMVFGTPHYMSPEQAQGKTLDPRSDIYSLGVVMYEALTGGLPFELESDVDILLAHIQKTPAPPSMRCQLPTTLEHLVMRMLEKKPEQRPPSAAAVAAVLSEISKTGRVQRPSKERAAETLALSSVEIPAVPEQKTTVVSPSATASLSSSQFQDRNRSTGGWLFILSLVLLTLAAAVTVWLVSRERAAPVELDQSSNQDATTVAIDGATAIDASGKAVDAAVAAPTGDQTNVVDNDGGPKLSSRERKALSLYQQAMSKWRRGGDELDYVPLLDEARRLDRNNRAIRRAFVRALLSSSDLALKARGCQWIKNDAPRRAKHNCP